MINRHMLKICSVFFLLTGFILLLSACSQSRIKKSRDIRKVVFVHQLPVITLNGELHNMKDSMPIYDQGDKIVYGLPYTYSVENDTAIILQETRFKYLACKRGATYGNYYDSTGSISFVKVRVDSLLKERAFSGGRFCDNSNDSIVQQIKGKGQFNLIEKYITKMKPDQSYPDTTIFYYTNRLKGFEYSLCPELEQLRNLKVYKIRMIYNSQFYKGYSFKFPSREFIFELKEIKDPIGKEIVAIFDSLK